MPFDQQSGVFESIVEMTNKYLESSSKLGKPYKTKNPDISIRINFAPPLGLEPRTL